MNRKKRILVTIDWFLPGYKAGGPIQSCANLIAHLKDNFEFWVLTRDSDYCSDIPYIDIQADNWTKLEEQVNVYYFSSKNLTALNLIKVIKAVNADIAYVNGVYSPYFSILPVIILKALRHPNIIVAGRGMLAPGSVNVKGVKKKLYFRLAKAINLFHGIRFHATNEAEMSDIEYWIGKKTNINIAPNLPKVHTSLNHVPRKKQPGILRLISIARVSPEKNTKFALEILCKYKGDGSILFTLYGPVYNEEYWQECEQVIQKMPPNVKVVYKGSLASSLVFETLQEHDVMFMPTRGENFGHIILESLTAGCPVIISNKTPWHRLQDLGIGYDLPLDDAGAYLKAIEEFISMDTDSFSLVSAKSFIYAKDYIDDPATIAANHQLFSV